MWLYQRMRTHFDHARNEVGDPVWMVFKHAWACRFNDVERDFDRLVDGVPLSRISVVHV